ncbi:MAG: c-type cytochrome biogenesis protein CcsB [Dermabacter sp.]|nr:c-type cytochrome biogenesis protein CcsB [Dermabacter sp.]
MITSPLADYSQLAIISAIVVYMMAFIAFAVDLAQDSDQRSEKKLRARAEALVGAGGSGAAQAEVTAPDGGDSARESGAVTSGGITALRIALTFATVATLLQFTGVILRGIATERVPWGNMYEFTMTGAAVVMTLYLLLSARLPDLRHLGVFILGPVLVLMLIAQTSWFLPAAALTPSLQNSHWLVIHVIVAILSIALFSIGAVTSVLQLVQTRRERRALEGLPVAFPAHERVMRRLPSARRLEALSFQVNAVGFVLWTFTLITGSIWANYAWGRYWGWDPKEVWTFVIWVVYAAYLHARATQGFRGTRAAYFALAGFASVVINYTVVNTVINGLHSYSGL